MVDDHRTCRRKDSSFGVIINTDNCVCNRILKQQRITSLKRFSVPKDDNLWLAGVRWASEGAEHQFRANSRWIPHGQANSLWRHSAYFPINAARADFKVCGNVQLISNCPNIRVDQAIQISKLLWPLKGSILASGEKSHRRKPPNATSILFWISLRTSISMIGFP